MANNLEEVNLDSNTNINGKVQSLSYQMLVRFWSRSFGVN